MSASKLFHISISDMSSKCSRWYFAGFHPLIQHCALVWISRP